MADNDREALLDLAYDFMGDGTSYAQREAFAGAILARWRLSPHTDQAVTSVHPEELNADLRVKGPALCECGGRFTGAHNHPACLYCQVAPGSKHDWTKPHPRMVWRLDADHE